MLFLCLFAVVCLLPGLAWSQEQEDTRDLPTERDGVLAVEAEAFDRQTKTDLRTWHIIDAETDEALMPQPDGDPAHVEGASGGAYLELLPDTRRTHDDPMHHGENFSNQPGVAGVLEYDVRFTTPGRYYVWARVYSTGTEDNSLHVGVNGDWPDSGKRMQWCKDKRTWKWEARQRVPDNHCGDPNTIYLDIVEPGIHTIAFSMREDGVEFDKWLMVNDRMPPLQGPSPESDLPLPLPDESAAR